MGAVMFSQVNLVVRHMDQTLTFYRRLGLTIPEEAIWRTDSGAHHVTIAQGADVGMDVDSRAFAPHWNSGYAAERGQVVLGFRLETRDAVDALYEEMRSHGHQGLQPPFDSFWGARYAIIEDPDGNPVGLMSPVDPGRRVPPPRV